MADATHDSVRKWQLLREERKRLQASLGRAPLESMKPAPVEGDDITDSMTDDTVSPDASAETEDRQALVIRFSKGLMDLDSRRMWDKFVVVKTGSESHRIMEDCLSFLGKGAHGIVAQACETDLSDPSGCSADVCIAIKFQKETADSLREARFLEMLTGNPELRPYVTQLYGQRRILDPNVPIFKPPQYMHIMYMEVLRAPYQNVTEFIERAPAPLVVRQLPDIIRQVLMALILIRRRFPGIKHNDLSPNNVFLTGLRAERAVIGDWGLAFDIGSPDLESVPSSVVLWDYRWEDGTPRPVFQDYRKIGRYIEPSETFAPDNNLDNAYMIPTPCQYYDWHLFMFWVQKYLNTRAIHVPIVRTIRTLMFDNAMVQLHPKYRHLVEVRNRINPYPGRLTGEMQLEIEIAISEARLVSLEKAYERLFGRI